MDMNNIRLDDKLNVMTLVAILAIALAIGSTLVGVEADTRASETAQAVPAQTTASTQADAGITLVAAQTPVAQ
jgi:hypothetical protein